MDDLTIDDIEDDLLYQLRIRAAEHGRSIEDEAGEILRAALTAEPESGLRGPA